MVKVIPVGTDDDLIVKQLLSLVDEQGLAAPPHVSIKSTHFG